MKKVILICIFVITFLFILFIIMQFFSLVGFGQDTIKLNPTQVPEKIRQMPYKLSPAMHELIYNYRQYVKTFNDSMAINLWDASGDSMITVYVRQGLIQPTFQGFMEYLIKQSEGE